MNLIINQKLVRNKENYLNKISIKIVCILLFVLTLSCNQATQKRENIKKSSFSTHKYFSHLKNKNGDTSYIETLLKNESYSLLVKTKTINTYLKESYVFNFDNVIDQKLCFFRDNKLLKEITYSPWILDVECCNGNNIMLLENVLYKVSIIKKNNSWIYAIHGSGISGTQTEYLGLFTPNGNLIWYQYISYLAMKVVKSEHYPFEVSGDIDSALNVYNLSTDDLFAPYLEKDIETKK